jgi:hypothetical protein
VIVKGGPASNVYANPSVLPPTLGADQHYISPLNGGGNVPTIGHWFVCYHVTTPPPVGSLALAKIVEAPAGEPASPLPTSYSALVNCNDGIPAHTGAVLTVPAGGGDEPPVLTGITNGAVCTVTEQNTGSFPAGTTVSYTPATANSTGVTISGNTETKVSITNNYSAVAVLHGTVDVIDVVDPDPNNVPIPPTFTDELACDDGTDDNVTLPSGTTSTPTVTPASTETVNPDVGSLCALQEATGALPPGWEVTYSVDGGRPTTTLPEFSVPDSTTITVTVTNNPINVSPAVVTQPAAQAQPVTVQPSFTG